MPGDKRKYAVILADPPWEYHVYSKKGKGRSAESHYPTMRLADIKALPVADIADKVCALFLWATFPQLEDALAVIRAWGFTYKTVAFAWVKQNKKSDSLFWGMGYWTRANVELCLLATRGTPRRASAGVHQVVVSHIQEHSRKPEEIHKRIIQLMGDVPRAELFARRKADGFDVWGNEVENEIRWEPNRKDAWEPAFRCRIPLQGNLFAAVLLLAFESEIHPLHKLRLCNGDFAPAGSKFTQA